MLMWIWSGSVALRVLTSAGSVSGRVLLPSWKLLKFTVTGAPTGVPVNELWAAAEHAASAACWQPDMCLSGGALSGNVTGPCTGCDRRPTVETYQPNKERP